LSIASSEAGNAPLEARYRHFRTIAAGAKAENNGTGG
jgi:hypothetical protein